MKQDLQIINREITANEFGARARAVLVAESDNRAASSADGLDVRDVGHAMKS